MPPGPGWPGKDLPQVTSEPRLQEGKAGPGGGRERRIRRTLHKNGDFRQLSGRAGLKGESRPQEGIHPAPVASGRACTCASGQLAGRGRGVGWACLQASPPRSDPGCRPLCRAQENTGSSAALSSPGGSGPLGTASASDPRAAPPPRGRSGENARGEGLRAAGSAWLLAGDGGLPGSAAGHHPDSLP